MADKSGGNRPGLLDFVKTRVGGAIAALRAFGNARKYGNRKPESPLFGNHERIVEAKYYPMAAPHPVEEGGELPDSYGKPKVTLMVVNPYLVHAYWDIDLTRLPPQTSSAVLRFHDTSVPLSFGVEVDLRARNWYVHLSSPAKSYYADLGVKTADGSVSSLVRSNNIQTPRAWPMADTGPTGGPGEYPARLAPPPLLAAMPPPQMPLPEGRDSESTLPSRDHQEGAVKSKSLQVLRPVVDAGEMLQRKLAEIYALRRWEPRATAAAAHDDAPFPNQSYTASRPEGAGPSPPSPQVSAEPPAHPDLTALAERQFSPGFSSAFLASHTPQRHPG